MTGFNPFSGRLFLAADSQVWTFLETPEIKARSLNRQDFFIKDLLFTLHDYLHVWALRFLNQRFPQLGICTKAIDAESLETFAFCHILTEAAATIGLDFWYLSTLDLNEIVCLGTEFRAGLTTSYEERLIHEYRRGNPDFQVQRPHFFTDMARFYCDGVLHGFNMQDLNSSPCLYRWIHHEIVYGQEQRVAIRRWLSFLAGHKRELSETEAGRAIALDADWQVRAIQELGDALWKLVKHDESIDLPPLPDRSEYWQTRAGSAIDPRFVNFRQVDEDELLSCREHPFILNNFNYVVWQTLAGCSLADFDPELLKIVNFIREKKDLKLLLSVLKSCPRVAAADEAPRDIMLIN
jgi:hypothetical protein